MAEVLAYSIPANPRIEGFCLPGSSDPLSPISQYADDTSLVVCSDDAIRACFEVSDVYERGSGSKLNLSKGLWLGPTAPTRPLLLIGCPSKLRFSLFF